MIAMIFWSEDMETSLFFPPPGTNRKCVHFPQQIVQYEDYCVLVAQTWDDQCNEV